MVSGIVFLDKPQGWTSRRAVNEVARLFGGSGRPRLKAGHAGTLDPMATGVLAIALGEATKTVPYAMDAEKTYRFTAEWGTGTDSDDAEGKVIATSDVRPAREAIEAAIPALTGEISQIPPIYSAIKVQGERAYDLAREGEAVELQPRTIQIHEARLVEIAHQAGEGRDVGGAARGAPGQAQLADDVAGSQADGRRAFSRPCPAHLQPASRHD